MRRWSVIGGVAAALGGLLYFLLVPGSPLTFMPGPEERSRSPKRQERTSFNAHAGLEPSRAEQPSELPDTGSWEEETPDAPGKLSLRGVVTDAQGQPLADVSVGAELLSPYVEDPQSFAEEETEVKGTTDAQGRFRLRSLVPGNYGLTFKRARFISQDVEDYALTPEAAPLAVVLQLAPSVEGRVVDTAGNPLPGVAVTLDGIPAAAQAGGETDGEPALSEGTEDFTYVAEVGLYSDKTKTGPEGTFVLDAPEPGTWRLRAEAKGFVPVTQELPVPARDVWIVLGEGASVEATVVDAQDRPVPGATVGLWVEDSRDPFLVEAPVDEAGRAVLQGLEPGRYVLVAIPPPSEGFRFVTQPLTLSGAEIQRVRMRLDEGLSLSGVVVDPSGRPVPDVEVQGFLATVVDPEREHVLQRQLSRFDDRRLSAKHKARTGPDGQFMLSHLLPVIYGIRFEKKGYVMVRLSGSERGEPESNLAIALGGERGMRVVLAYRGLVSGRVVRSGGKPITSFVLNGYDHESPDGTFSLVAGAPGPDAVQIVAEGVGGLRREYVAKEGEDVNLGDLVLGEGRPVRVRVEDATSAQPIADARVMAKELSEERELSSEELGCSAPPTTRQDGTCRLTDVPQRPLALRVQHKRYEGAQVVLDPRDQEVTFRLRPWATLQGWVRAGGEPVAEGDVKVYSLDGEKVANLEVKDGWYSDHLVPPGSYIVRGDCDSCPEPEPIFVPRRIEVPGPRERLWLDLEAAGGGALLEVQAFEEVRRLALVRGRPPRPTNKDELTAASVLRHQREDGEGESYRFRNVPAGPHTLLGIYTREDGTEVFLYEELELPEEGTIRLELQRPQGGLK